MFVPPINREDTAVHTEPSLIPRLLSGVSCLFYLGSSSHFFVLINVGALGPGHSFSPGQIYGHLLWFFLVGPLAVLLTWTLGRKWKFFNYISWPVVFGGMSLVPPATGINFSSWWAFNAIFNGIIKRRRGAWWSKYSEWKFYQTF